MAVVEEAHCRNESDAVTGPALGSERFAQLDDGSNGSHAGTLRDGCRGERPGVAHELVEEVEEMGGDVRHGLALSLDRALVAARDRPGQRRGRPELGQVVDRAAQQGHQ